MRTGFKKWNSKRSQEAWYSLSDAQKDRLRRVAIEGTAARFEALDDIMINSGLMFLYGDDPGTVAVDIDTLKKSKIFNKLVLHSILDLRKKEENKIRPQYAGEDKEIPFEFSIKIKVSGRLQRRRYDNRTTGKRIHRADFICYEMAYDFNEMRDELDEAILKQIAKVIRAKKAGPTDFDMKLGGHKEIGFVNHVYAGKKKNNRAH